MDESDWDTDDKVLALVEDTGTDAIDAIFRRPIFLKTFLRARRGDVEAAKRMLLRHQQLRQEKCAPHGWPSATRSILSHINEQMAQKKAYIRGVDKQGRPLLIIRADRHNASVPEMESFVLFMIDCVVANLHLGAGDLPSAQPGTSLANSAADTQGSSLPSAESPPQTGAEGVDASIGRPNSPPQQFTAILDFTQFGLANIDIEVAKYIVTILKSHFPEHLGRMLFVNGGWAFWTVWQAIRFMIDPRTEKKIAFINSTDLSDEIDEDHIPAFLGGKDTYDFQVEHAFGPEGDGVGSLWAGVATPNGLLNPWLRPMPQSSAFARQQSYGHGSVLNSSCDNVNKDL